MAVTISTETMKQILDLGSAHALNTAVEEFHPHDIAEAAAGLDDETLWQLLRQLLPPLKAEVFSHLPIPRQVVIASAQQPRDVANLLKLVAPDDRVDLVQELDAETREEILKEMEEPQRADVEHLARYGEGTVGSVMSSEVAVLYSGMRVDEAIARLREMAAHKETIYYNYVVDTDGRLIGIVSLRDLILAEGQKLLSDVMGSEVVSIEAGASMEAAAALIREYDLLALPVTYESRLVGIVTVDDVIDVLVEQQTDNMLKMGAIEAGALDEPYLGTPFATLVRKRAGWLVVLFLGEMLTATAMGYFEDEIEKAVVLALFVPLIISSGGNSGSQAATLIIRAMALHEVTLKDWWIVMRREILSGLTLGSILGVIGFLRIVVWSAFTPLYGPHWLLIAMTVGISLVGVVMWGTLSGSMLPFILKRLGADPASSSAPFVATLVDVTGLAIYFTVALFILSGTLL